VSGCSATSSAIVVTVNPLPIANITANGATTFCQGDSLILAAGEASSYLWSNGVTSQTIIVKSSGNYSVAVSNVSGCSATSSTIAVTVNPLPTAKITQRGETTFCQGDSLILVAGEASSYLWSNGATSQSILVKSSGNYSVEETNPEGCSATSQIIPVTVLPLPQVPSITANGNVLYVSSSNGNQWYLDGNIINGAVSQTYLAIETGNYTVVFTDSNGCSAESAPYHFIYEDVAELSGDIEILIVPNPSDDFIEISLGTQWDGSTKVIYIYNPMGVCSSVEYANSYIKRIDISAFSEGLYFLKVDGKIYKFVKL
jgi:hypothetical protein